MFLNQNLTFLKVFQSKFNILTLNIAKFVQVLESFKDLFRHRYSFWLHFGHGRPSHFGSTNGFLGLFHALFGWNFILKCDAYWWSSSPRRHPCCYGHFVFKCSLSTFLSNMDNISHSQAPWKIHMWIQTENTERIMSWDMFPNSQHFRGRGACCSSRMGIRISDKQVNYSYKPAQTKQQVG
jgi:hypothetical protein